VTSPGLREETSDFFADTFAKYFDAVCEDVCRRRDAEMMPFRHERL
jgi:hypothetical protein